MDFNEIGGLLALWACSVMFCSWSGKHGTGNIVIRVTQPVTCFVVKGGGGCTCSIPCAENVFAGK